MTLDEGLGLIGQEVTGTGAMVKGNEAKRYETSQLL